MVVNLKLPQSSKTETDFSYFGLLSCSSQGLKIPKRFLRLMVGLSFYASLIIVSPAFAEILLCPNSSPTKWVSGLFGDKAQVKISGRWVDFCGEGEVRESRVAEDDALFVQSCVYGDQSVEMQTDMIAHDDPKAPYFSRDYELIDFELAMHTYGRCVVTGEKVTECNPKYETDECMRLK